jgi:hypothetical protein
MYRAPACGGINGFVDIEEMLLQDEAQSIVQECDDI